MVAKDATLDHCEGTPEALFGGLKERHVLPDELIATLAQNIRDTQKRRRVNVVATRVHDTLDGGAVRQVALFEDWETALQAVEFFKKREPEPVMRGFREVIFRADPDGREAGLLRAIGLEIGHFLRRAGFDVPLPRGRDEGTPSGEAAVPVEQPSDTLP